MLQRDLHGRFVVILSLGGISASLLCNMLNEQQDVRQGGTLVSDTAAILLILSDSSSAERHQRSTPKSPHSRHFMRVFVDLVRRERV